MFEHIKRHNLWCNVIIKNRYTFRLPSRRLCVWVSVGVLVSTETGYEKDVAVKGAGADTATNIHPCTATQYTRSGVSVRHRNDDGKVSRSLKFRYGRIGPSKFTAHGEHMEGMQ